MISPELLRRYPFFGMLNDVQLREVAMITNKCSIAGEATIFSEDQEGEGLYLLIEGSVDLYFSSHNAGQQTPQKEYLVGEVNPGEIFGISALVEPYRYSATARATSAAMVLHIEAPSLRQLFAKDERMGFLITQQAARAFAERLHFTRIQLAAARTE